MSELTAILLAVENWPVGVDSDSNGPQRTTLLGTRLLPKRRVNGQAKSDWSGRRGCGVLEKVSLLGYAC